MKKKVTIIAFDGTSASGKSTLAKMVSVALGCHYFDTGLMYRKLAYLILKKDINFNNKSRILEIANQVSCVQTTHDILQIDEVANMASIVATDVEVRRILVKKQKQFISFKQDIVVDGRDIATNVCPDAKYKFYFDADISIRSKRRFHQLQKRKRNVVYEDVYDDIKARDYRDKTRSNFPLVKADDCIVIDSSNISISKAFNTVLKKINNK